MLSSKPFFALACLLCLALPALAEKKPNDTRSSSTDSSSTYSLYTRPKVDKIGGQPLEHWVHKLTDADPSSREDAVVAIVQFGEDAGPYVPKICQITHDHDAAPKVKAIMALGIMYVPETQRSAVYKELGHSLVDPYSESIHRYEAVKSLLTLMRMRFGPPKGEERKIIMDLVKIGGSSRNNALREICIDAIMAAGIDPEKGPDSNVTDFLIKRATPAFEPAEKVRFKAILALGAQGQPRDKNKLGQVVYVLKHNTSRNRIVRMWTHVSLMALGEKVPKRELDAIANLIQEPDSQTKISAITALGTLRDKADPYVKDICIMAKREKDPMVLMIVAQAMGGMGNKGKHVLETLIKITEMDSPESVGAVFAACSALKELGVNDAATMKAIEQVREHRALNAQQKDLVKKLIEDMRNPPKKR